MAAKKSDLGDVIAIGPPKEAALYFDRVLPFDMAKGYMQRVADPDHDLNIPHYDGKFSLDVISSLLPGYAKSKDTYGNLVVASFMGWTVQSIAEDSESREIFLKDIPGSPLGGFFEAAGLNPQAVVEDLRCGRASSDRLIDKIIDKIVMPLVVDAGFQEAPSWTAESTISSNKSEAARFMATMKGVNVVDPTTVSWTQIVEFRKDEESKKALRDLRLFFSENFDGQDPGYVADKLEQLMEQHDQAAKTWGLGTKLSALSVLFTKETAMAAGAAVIATQFGVPGILAAGAPAAFAIGKVGIDFSKVFVDAKKNRIDRPVRYLSDMKRKLD